MCLQGTRSASEAHSNAILPGEKNQFYLRFFFDTMDNLYNNFEGWYVDDVLVLAKPILRHRMALTFAARADGVTIDEVIDRLCAPLA